MNLVTFDFRHCATRQKQLLDSVTNKCSIINSAFMITKKTLYWNRNKR